MRGLLTVRLVDCYPESRKSVIQKLVPDTEKV